MKLPGRMAGICSSGVFLITALPGIYQDVMPSDLNQISRDVAPGMNIVETLLISMAGSIAAGIIGFAIGNILSHPRGKRKKPALPKMPPLSVKAETPEETAAALPENANSEPAKPSEGNTPTT